MKSLTTAAAFALLFVCQAFAGEHSALARVTVYWHREGSGEHASWTGAQLREKHCAVDPKKIPYGSKVVFPDATCVAADSGPAVVNRKAARSCGRTAAERNAIVIDRFFDTKQKALGWAKGHPHFMTVRILTPGTEKRSKLVATKNPRSSATNIFSSSTTSWRGRTNDFYQGFESSLDGAGAAVGQFIFAICQVQNISAYALLFAACALLAAAFHSSICQLFSGPSVRRRDG
jgi:3D (Asp-Asp-Asp) domain-containing protein